MGKVVLVVAALLSGCLKPSAFQCGDGRTCPSDTTCDDVRGLCLSEAQTTACKGIADGKPCDAAGTPGICDRGFCEPGCGDGVTDTNEQCDDGNFASHDGCSSRCVVEVFNWVPDRPVWKGVTQLSAAYHPGIGSGRILVFGGLDTTGISDAIWQIDPSKVNEVEGGWVDISGAFAPGERPSPRYGASIAYHAADGVLVMHGGAHATGYYAETWEYEPSANTYKGEPVGVWTKKTPATSPGALFAPAMAYEPNLGKVVLYGGSAQASPTWRMTWLYSAGTWTSMSTSVMPSVTTRGQMVYDPNRSVLVLYGATTVKTWELTGTDWVDVPITEHPGTRRGAMMAYDPTRLQVVLFGGANSQQTEVRGDTWAYDGAWHLIDTPVSPPARRTAALVTDPVNNRLVLFGGNVLDGSEPFNDEWELTPNGWANHTPRFSPGATLGASGAYSVDDGSYAVVGATSVAAYSTLEFWTHDGTRWRHDVNVPVDRIEQQLVYDTDAKRFIMTGGYCGIVDVYQCDPNMDGEYEIAMPATSYAFDVATRTWSKLAALWPLDQTRSVFAYVYDQVAHRSVVFGGYLENGMKPVDTWVSDGTTWTQLVTAEHPAATIMPAAGWDPVRGAVIVFDSAGDTWELRDSTWTKLIPASDTGPAGREQSGMTYNRFRKRFVLVAGDGPQGEFLDDIWELDTETLAWTRLFVAGSTPLPRRAFAFGMQENRRAPVLYGGSGGTLFGRSDVWFLEMVSSTVDEDCTDGVDTDDDAQDDTEDPDCSPPPPP